MAYNYGVKNNNTQVDYTVYGAGNQVFLPINTEILIPSDEPVRLLSAIMEEMDYTKLMATYSRMGRIEYPPRLLFKVIVYAYSRKIVS
jgi:transposase